MTGPAPDWRALSRTIAGEVVLPGSPGYEAARRPAIARFHDVRPQAVVMCETAADVAEAIGFAARSGIHTAIRGGGHSFAGYSTTRGMVVDVTPMRAVGVRAGVATVGAGARLGEVYGSLASRGLTLPAGCGPTVGIAGLTLGGGLGILGRTYGLTCDQLLAARVVLADGAIVDCDVHHHDDLFWALRGAGAGNFGVVTSFVFGTVPAPAATAFHVVWPYGHAAAVIGAWQEWAPAAPGELAASLLVSTADEPGMPPLVSVFGAVLGTESDAAELLAEMAGRAGCDPVSASWRQMPYQEAKRYLDERDASGRLRGETSPSGPSGSAPSQEGHPYSKSEYFGRTLPGEAIRALVQNFTEDQTPGQRRELDFTPWGGAYGRVPRDATAFAHRGDRFLLKHAAVVGPDAPDAVRESALRWLTRSWEAAHRWGTGRVYPNFPDPDLPGWGHAYYGANYDRLLRVKARYDPSGRFAFQQSLPVAG